MYIDSRNIRFISSLSDIQKSMDVTRSYVGVEEPVKHGEFGGWYNPETGEYKISKDGEWIVVPKKPDEDPEEGKKWSYDSEKMEWIQIEDENYTETTSDDEEEGSELPWIVDGGGVLQLYDENEPEIEEEEEEEPVTGTYMNLTYNRKTGILTIDTDYPEWYAYIAEDGDMTINSFDYTEGTVFNMVSLTGYQAQYAMYYPDLGIYWNDEDSDEYAYETEASIQYKITYVN